MSRKNKISMRNNYQYIDTAVINDQTFYDYLYRFKKVATSIFEWVNLPKSMDARWLEQCLYYGGQAALLKDKKYGFINTKCCASETLNIYGLPTSLHCFSFQYDSIRKLYTGLIPEQSEAKREQREYYEAILVMNNFDRLPTCGSMELFALRLYEAERTADVNIKAQKTPIMLLVNDNQRLTMENLYMQYDGNKPFIFGDKDNLSETQLKAISTEAPFIADKIIDYGNYLS